MQNNITNPFNKITNIPKIFILGILFVNIFGFASACTIEEEIQNKIDSRNNAIKKYQESQESINQSLNKIIKNANGILLKKIIINKQDTFNTLVNDLILKEKQYIEYSSSTKTLFCDTITKEKEQILEDINNKILEKETEIIAQKAKTENYITKDLKKVLIDLKEATIIKEDTNKKANTIKTKDQK